MDSSSASSSSAPAYSNSGPVTDWLAEAAERGASDLHLISGYPPTLRRHGRLEPLASDPIADSQLREWLMPLVPVELRGRLDRDLGVDFAMQLPGGRRYRANYFLASRQLGACFRVIPEVIPDFQWAGFPLSLAERLADFRNGLVIFCGVTGAGKTTSLAMIVNLLCQRGGYRIVTIEEPIEYRLVGSSGTVVTQREVGSDVPTFADGLRQSLRQDPNVILIGEIRDKDTAQTALSAAETGHLVLATLHTRDARGAVSRYADFFPQDTQMEIRAQLAIGLRAVVSQHLLPHRIEGERRVLALEVMFNTSPIASAIRTGKIESIDNYILTGRSAGMITLNESVKRHLEAGTIDEETAERFSTDRAFVVGRSV